MKLWHTMFILTFIILYGTLSVAILSSWVYEKARALHGRRVFFRRKGLRELLLVILTTLAVSGSPLHAGSETTVANLRGDQVRVPMEVPPKERFVLQRLISVDDRLIVFLYRDPKFRHPVDYAETYNLMGELLEITWVEPTGGLTIARDINLGNPKAKGPARVLEIVDVRKQGPVPNGEPDTLAEDGTISLEAK